MKIDVDWPSQELQIPQNMISDGLNENDPCQDSTGDDDFLSYHNHDTRDELAEEVEEDEQRGQEPTTVPRIVHELPLFAPLEPHSDVRVMTSLHSFLRGGRGSIIFAVLLPASGVKQLYSPIILLLVTIMPTTSWWRLFKMQINSELRKICESGSPEREVMRKTRWWLLLGFHSLKSLVLKLLAF